MTRMTRPDCAVMCNLINTHTHTLYDLMWKVHPILGAVESASSGTQKAPCINTYVP